ncbi:MAG: hypothetical protein JNL72_15030 [Flavipsychrobacter sp.]|nr:hypothetical protein [Flavipsychrobacter sp.]
MHRFLIVIILACFAVSCSEERPVESSGADEVASGAEYSSFIPGGLVLLDTAVGHLDGDSIPDMVLVLKSPQEDSTSDVVDHPEPRPLLILLGTAPGKYRLVARCDKSVFCVNCGGAMGDPYQGIIIRKGSFSIEHYGGSAEKWAYAVTHSYSGQDKEWYLDKLQTINYTFGEDSLESQESVKSVSDFGKIKSVDFDIYNIR